MYNIKFKVDGGIYEFDLMRCELNYTGLMSSEVKQIFKVIEEITENHFQENITPTLKVILQKELKEQIESKGYILNFIEGE